MFYLAGQRAALASLGFTKEALRIPVIHGTSGPWKQLKATTLGKTILANDPNPRGIYAATARRAARKPVEGFAHDAVKARGGAPHVLEGKIDTSKGWEPHTLTAWGRKNIGDVDDALELIYDLENATPDTRGPLWKKLQRGIGAWRNTQPDAVWTPRKAVKL